MQHSHITAEQLSWECLDKEYTILEQVGEGSYGQVKKAVHKESKFKVAIKRI